MRIISGSLKGRQLRFPKYIRPTQNKVRKAIFDVLGKVVEGGKALELFAGSGAVGIEALSYGAKEVTFVDNDKDCLKIIEKNLIGLGVSSGIYQIYKMDSLKAIDYLTKRDFSFDFIFLDPPYKKGLAKNSLRKIGACDILNSLGFLVVEHSKNEELPVSAGGLTLYKHKRYADKIVSFYHA